MILLDGWHPSMIKICSMHTLQLGLLFAANGGALYCGYVYCIVSLFLFFVFLPLLTTGQDLPIGQGTPSTDQEGVGLP